MDIGAALSFFGIMLALAALPSASVALVVTRATTHGIKNGLAVAGGIVVADLAFIALVLVGLTVLAETMGAFFAVLKYLGGAYLIWLGYSLMRSKVTLAATAPDSAGSSCLVSFLAGFALTLGDLKAILFYASLFPSLFDLTALSATDITIIVATTVLTVGGVKAIYAFAARNLVERLSTASATGPARRCAGGVLMGTGTYLIAKG